MNKIITNKKGFSPLFCILIICAAALIIAVNSAVIGQGEMDLCIASSNGKMALDIANSCSNETLQRIKAEPDYTIASTSLPVGEGSCIISIVELSPNQKKILIQGIYNEYYKHIAIELKIINGNINIYDWNEY
jgi:hypothetical protein